MTQPRTVQQIIAALRDEVTEDGHILLDELEREALLSFWPEPVFEAARAIFGDVVFNRDSRTYVALDRRIRHALRTWEARYGPLVQEQRDYAHTVLIAALRRGSEDAGSDRRKLYPFVQSRLGLSVNHEIVDAGFKRRAQLVDTAPILAALA